MATRRRRFVSPQFHIRILTPQELDTTTKEKIFRNYKSRIESFSVEKEKVGSRPFARWKRQLQGVGGHKKAMVDVCSLLHKTYSGRNNIDLNLEAKKQIVAALSYALDPVDIIPDYVPGVGYLDDIYCINLCLSKLKTSCPELWEEVKTLLERL